MSYNNQDNFITKQGYRIPIITPLTELPSFNTTPPLHILASGNSITNVNMAKVSEQPCIFINGSIQLYEQTDFALPAAYVISDERFIEHNVDLMKQYYHGQCLLYISQSVLKKLNKVAPDYLATIQPHIRLIYNFLKPITQKKTGLLKKIITKNQPRHINSDAIVLKANTEKPIIGVSTDIRHGFVEAGTVAFIATQLAYSFGFKEICVHGMDLLNTDEPRFYENQNNQAPCKLDKAIKTRIIPSFDFLAETYRQTDVLVYNGSPVSQYLFNNLSFTANYLLQY
ncbi:MAG: hypothetical protein KGV50_04315 [Gammaproteobacteria bacterium]|nr:hypothetical protein [Gammaproteobacteria bacterium]